MECENPPTRQKTEILLHALRERYGSVKLINGIIHFVHSLNLDSPDGPNFEPLRSYRNAMIDIDHEQVRFIRAIIQRTRKDSPNGWRMLDGCLNEVTEKREAESFNPFGTESSARLSVESLAEASIKASMNNSAPGRENNDGKNNEQQVEERELEEDEVRDGNGQGKDNLGKIKSLRKACGKVWKKAKSVIRPKESSKDSQ